MLARLRGWLLQGRPVRYDDTFFGDAWFRGWETLRDVLCELLQSERRWRSILDFGCGPGVMIDLMNARGVDYVGCDFSPEARTLYLQHYGGNPEKYVSSIESVQVRPFDLMVSFDVMEHMRDEEISVLLKQVADVPELLLNISRARSIPGHVNIKSDRAWIRFFGSQGWTFDAARTAGLRSRYLALRPGGSDEWHKNMFLFKRAARSA